MTQNVMSLNDDAIGPNDSGTVNRAVHGGKLGEAVVEAVAEAKGISVAELDTLLYDIVDPDALERVFRPKSDGSQRAGGRIVFTMEDCEVVVHSDRTVTVLPPGNVQSRNTSAVSLD